MSNKIYQDVSITFTPCATGCSMVFTNLIKVGLPSITYGELDQTIMGDTCEKLAPHPIGKWEGFTFSTFDAVSNAGVMGGWEIELTDTDNGTDTVEFEGYIKSVKPREFENKGERQIINEVERAISGAVTIS